MSTQTPLPCVLEEQRKLCKLLSDAGVPQDPKWISLILYMRSLEFNETLSLEQKGKIQMLLVSILKEKDFSDAKFSEVTAMQEEVVTSPYRQKLQSAVAESQALLKEFGTLIKKRRGDVQDLGETTVQHVESGEQPDMIVQQLRSSFHKLVAVMDEDAKNLEQVARTDALTNLYNRRAFDEALEQRVGQAGNGKVPLTLLMLDIDHFKKINDKFGHAIGDQTLQVVARNIKRAAADNAGQHAFCARYGGEEFAVLLMGKRQPEAVAVAEAIREKVASVNLDVRTADGEVLHKGLKFTISIGVCQLDPAWGSVMAEKLVETADAALYKAKAGGRNRVES